MKTFRAPALVLGFLSCSLVSAAALAQGDAPDGSVAVVESQFTDKVDASKPVGDASSIGATATYFVVVGNKGEPTHVTLVWKLDDKEAGRQILDVGKSPRWRTWGTFPTKKAHTVA